MHFGFTAAEGTVITDALKRKWASGEDYQFNHTQNFLNFEHNPTDATFTLNTVLKLNALVYEKWNS